MSAKSLTVQQRDAAWAALERVTRERDEARAEVAALQKDRAWEANRANEAARLSADARDVADAHLKTIADLREQVGIIEADRLAYDAWALKVIAEHEIEYDMGDPLPVIAAFIRAVRKDNATLAGLVDRVVEAREYYYRQLEEAVSERDEARAEVVRLGKELDITIADAQHYRHLYEQLTARVEEVRQAGIEASEVGS